MIGFLIWHSLFNSDRGTSRGSKLIPLPPRHLMTERPERPEKIKKKNKKKKNGKSK
jgi:hypothetical protein